jgi:hypothetical protein
MYAPSPAVAAQNASFDGTSQNYTIDIFDAYNGTNFMIGDAVTIMINITSALTNSSYLTYMYRTITDGDINAYKLRFEDRFIVTTANSQAVTTLYYSGYYFIQALITRNIDKPFSYVLPNIMANTIARMTTNLGFVVTIRSTLAIPLSDNTNVAMTLNVVLNNNVTIYSIVGAAAVAFGN